MGVAFGVGSALTAVCLLPAGYLADRLGPKPILVSGWVVSTVGAALLLPLRDWHAAVIGLSLLTIGNIASPASSAYVAAVTDHKSLGGTMGVVWGAAFAGNVIGSPL